MCGAWDESPPCWHSERTETHSKVKSYRTIAWGGQECPKHCQWDNRELDSNSCLLTLECHKLHTHAQEIPVFRLM